MENYQTRVTLALPPVSARTEMTKLLKYVLCHSVFTYTTLYIDCISASKALFSSTDAVVFAQRGLIRRSTGSLQTSLHLGLQEGVQRADVKLLHKISSTRRVSVTRILDFFSVL